MKKLRSRVVWSSIFFLLIIGLLAQPILAKNIKVGIIQIVEHPALDSARKGFIDVLAENGYKEGENITYDYQNAQGDMSTANTIAQKFSLGNKDMILAIATPTAQAVANAVKNTPILITAVTDPVDAGLVDSMEKPNVNVTGTTDMTPVAKQLKLLLKFKPDAKKVGILYNAGESNSVVQVKLAKTAAKDLNIELVEATASNSGAVYQAAQSLANRVDALYVPTDNTVVSAIESVVKVAEDFDLPLIVGEESSVKRGALATEGINYYKLGRQTGEMALKILNDGADPAEMAIESLKNTTLVINQGAADRMGVKIPEELKNQAAEIIK